MICGCGWADVEGMVQEKWTVYNRKAGRWIVGDSESEGLPRKYLLHHGKDALFLEVSFSKKDPAVV